MPWSSDEGKDWIVDTVARLEPQSVIDFGAGAGRYADILKPVLPTDVQMDAVEVWMNNILRFHLPTKYRTVYVEDARQFEFPQNYDLAIFGDVGEHMEKDEFVFLWERTRLYVNYSILSIPIVHWPQGELEGNPYEKHIYHWSHEEILEDLPGIADFATYSQIGVYLGVGLGTMDLGF